MQPKVYQQNITELLMSQCIRWFCVSFSNNMCS